MAMDVHLVTCDFGSVNGAGPFPAVYLPAEGGAVSILDAYLIGSGAGTSIGAKLVSITDAGTPATANGTIGSFAGTVVYAANARAACTVSAPAVSGGNWIGVSQTSGTTPISARLVFSYVMGK